MGFCDVSAEHMPVELEVKIHVHYFSGLSCELHPLKEEWIEEGSWFWDYKITGPHVHLELVEL